MGNMDSYSRLHAKWPATCQTLVETYYPGEGFRRTYAHNMNDAGYILAALDTYAEHWHKTHGHHGVSQRTLDAAAANEVRYHHTRGRTFRRPAAGLGAAICNLVVERPEMILRRHRGQEVAYAGSPAHHR